MELAREYARQFSWRPWRAIFDALPSLDGRAVLDLGCAMGDQAAELAARGARVIGVDANGDLLQAARSRRVPNAEFREGDLRALSGIDAPVDGLWCSFTAAYFTDLPAVLASWGRFLAPGGWIALTEVDDLFGHTPLGIGTRSMLEAYARDALLAGRYDFHMGRKLAGHLERAGFSVTKALTLEDAELAFTGPARPEVVDAWRARFDRMPLLRDFCGSRFGAVREEFLRCLTLAEHDSSARICCCVGWNS